jgi:hypothetical protein
MAKEGFEGWDDDMSGDPRLKRLRELVGRLEQLPESDERNRVLREVRARAVDLDTGVAPRAMLHNDTMGGGRPDRRPAHPAPLPAPIKIAHVAPQQDCPPAALRWARSPMRPAPAPVTHSIDLLAAGERLCLEDLPYPETPGEPVHRPWARGLRG